jgi:hypothetical protein
MELADVLVERMAASTSDPDVIDIGLVAEEARYRQVSSGGRPRR